MKIKMTNDSDNSLPYNLDNSSHECRDSKKTGMVPIMAKPQPETTITEQDQITLESLLKRIKRLETSVERLEQRFELSQ